MTTPFRLDLSVEAFEKSDAGDKSRRICGIVSTDHLDRQMETLIQEGLDFGPFLKSGWFNDNHATDTDSVVGYPEIAELRNLPNGKRGWYVEGYLLKGDPEQISQGIIPRSEKIWGLAKSLQSTARRLGFSVEGAVVERDVTNPRIVRKAVVREVAITKCPVNEHTSLAVLAKSLAAGSAVPMPTNVPVTGSDGGGRLLVPQSLEAKPAKKKKKRIKKSEAIALLQKSNPRITRQGAEEIVEFAMRWHSTPDNKETENG